MSRRRNPTIALSLVALVILGLSGLSGCSTSIPAPPSDGMAKTTSAPNGGGASLLSDEAAAAITVDADLVYREVGGEEVRLDVCRGPGGDAPRAALMLIHGGAWHAGDKDTPQWQEICRWLADAGYVVVNLNYRLAPEHVFPAAIEDVQAAVQWTRDNAETYGIDPDRIGALGGSAGGNLAQLLGTSGDGPTTAGARVTSVISLSGLAELTEAGLRIGEPDADQIQRVLDYLGCPAITECPQAEAASPITHVDPSDPPFLLAHSEDENLPVEQAQVMADALTEAGASPEVRIRPGTAHATRLLAHRIVRDGVLDFLDRTLG